MLVEGVCSCACGVLQQNRRVGGPRNKIDELGSAQQKSGTPGNERILQQKILICPEKSILSGKITVPAAPMDLAGVDVEKEERQSNHSVTKLIDS